MSNAEGTIGSGDRKFYRTDKRRIWAREKMAAYNNVAGTLSIKEIDPEIVKRYNIYPGMISGFTQLRIVA